VMILAMLNAEEWLNPKQLLALLLPLLYLFHLVCFVAPGLPLAHLCVRRGWLPPVLALPVAIVGSCLLGYLVFSAFWASPVVGGLTALAAMTLAVYGWRGVMAAVQLAEVRTPLILMAAVGFFYVACEYVRELPEVEPHSHISYRFTDRSLHNDWEYPRVFSEWLVVGEDMRQTYGTWRSSDRPPLQNGLYLMQFWVAASPFRWLHYQLIGCALQCSWAPAVWVLCRLAKLPDRQAGVVVLFVAFSGFILVNTLYCWPKLLAGSLCLFALAALICCQRGAARLPTVMLAGTAAGLALLAHGAAAFTLLALALFCLTPRLFPGWRAALAGTACTFVLLAPWLAYQKWYDPPGDRLLKWHFAGVQDFVDKRPFGEALADAYRNKTLEELAENRLLNFASLFVFIPGVGDWFGEDLTPDQEASPLTRFRDTQFHQLFPMLGLLNLGWLALAVGLFSRSDPDSAVNGLLLGLTGIFIWVLLLFDPGAALVHRSSYADVLLLLMGLAIVLLRRIGWLIYPVLAVHTVIFVVAWVCTTPSGTPSRWNSYMIPVTVIAFVVLVGQAVGVWNREMLRWPSWWRTSPSSKATS
jgi:hypothetical protein